MSEADADPLPQLPPVPADRVDAWCDRMLRDLHASLFERWRTQNDADHRDDDAVDGGG